MNINVVGSEGVIRPLYSLGAAMFLMTLKSNPFIYVVLLTCNVVPRLNLKALCPSYVK